MIKNMRLTIISLIFSLFTVDSIYSRTSVLYLEEEIFKSERLSIHVVKKTNFLNVEELVIKLKGAEDIVVKLGIEIEEKGVKVKPKFKTEDNVLAFRYEGNNKMPVTVKREFSEWSFPLDTKVWYFERDNSWKLKSYAGTWTSCLVRDFHEISEVGPIQGLPLIFELSNGVYALLTEVGLRNYSGMRVEVKDGGVLSANFTEKDGFRVPKNFVSPWRVLFFAENLNDLVNQSIVEKLSAKPEKKLYKDKSYIVPGMCAWRWFARGTGTPSQEKEVIEQASKLNFKYTMVDDGWNKWPNAWDEMKNLVEFGKMKDVGVIVWKRSADILNPDNDYNLMRNWLDSVKYSGAVGVKVDFMDSEAKKLIDFDIKLLEEAAKRKLLVVFHGCQKPSGEQYTFPNEITREGVRGIELNKMGEGYISAPHNAALPFTRFVVGNGDYTPLTFTVPGETSFAHQLATLVCFTSAFQVIAEDTELLLTDSHVRPALDLIKNMPTVWDQTIVLEPSEIGKLAVIARKKGNKWYLGILNGEAKKKNVKLDLTALKILGKPELKIYLDNMDVEKVLLSMQGHRPAKMKREPSIPFKVEKQSYNSDLILEIAPNGGAVIEIIN